MKKLTILAAMAAMTLGGTAMAQMTSTESHMMPNGNMRTTNRVETPDGTASTTRVDRADGSTRIVHRQTDVMGNHHVVARDSRDGWNNRRVCNWKWHHGAKRKVCWTRHR